MCTRLPCLTKKLVFSLILQFNEEVSLCTICAQKKVSANFQIEFSAILQSTHAR